MGLGEGDRYTLAMQELYECYAKGGLVLRKAIKATGESSLCIWG